MGGGRAGMFMHTGGPNIRAPAICSKFHGRWAQETENARPLFHASTRVFLLACPTSTQWGREGTSGAQQIKRNIITTILKNIPGVQRGAPWIPRKIQSCSRLCFPARPRPRGRAPKTPDQVFLGLERPPGCSRRLFRFGGKPPFSIKLAGGDGQLPGFQTDFSRIRGNSYWAKTYVLGKMGGAEPFFFSKRPGPRESRKNPNIRGRAQKASPNGGSPTTGRQIAPGLFPGQGARGSKRRDSQNQPNPAWGAWETGHATVLFSGGSCGGGKKPFKLGKGDRKAPVNGFGRGSGQFPGQYLTVSAMGGGGEASGEGGDLPLRKAER